MLYNYRIACVVLVVFYTDTAYQVYLLVAYAPCLNLVSILPFPQCR